MEKITAIELKNLGFQSAAKELQAAEEFTRKCSLAYEHFKYVTPEQFERFNVSLRKKTEERTGKNKYGNILVYDKLIFQNIKSYLQSPPIDVLSKLKEAIGKNCFDSFEIAKIESQKEVPDPILFGTITGCPDKFFIAQWDNDVKISDIITDQEG